ncbi:hypothetical protein RRG08_036245 [Elysia crispata]|nr:hypothetical protein RRG08_036245 [Elysia crispata]
MHSEKIAVCHSTDDKICETHYALYKADVCYSNDDDKIWETHCAIYKADVCHSNDGKLLETHHALCKDRRVPIKRR